MNVNYIDLCIYFSGVIIIYLLLKNIKKRDAMKSLEDFSFINDDCQNDFESQKVYNDAKQAFDDKKYSKSIKLVNDVKNLNIKEKPLKTLITKIENNRMLETSNSASLIQKAKDEIKKLNFDNANHLLDIANGYVEQENLILNEINKIKEQILPVNHKYFNKTIDLINEILHDLKDGNFESAELQISNAKMIFTEELKNVEYDVKKNALINEMKKVY